MDDAAPAIVKFRCPACGRKFATKADLAGKKVRCSGCGQGVRVPHADSNAVAVAVPAQTAPGADARGQEPARPARSSSARKRQMEAADAGDRDQALDSSSLLDALAAVEGVQPSNRAGTVLTPRSAMIEAARQSSDETTVAAPETDQKPKKRKGKKKKAKKKTGTFDPKETLKLVAGVGAFVALLAFLAWGYPDLRFPLGGFLSVIGFIVYLLGAYSIRQLVREEGALKALVFRFCPPYQWYYVATNWADTKDFVAFFVAGVIIMSIGGAVIRTSAVGKKAEASERAFQKAQQARRVAEPSPSLRPSTARAVGVAEADD